MVRTCFAVRKLTKAATFCNTDLFILSLTTRLEDSKVLHGPFVPSGHSRFAGPDKTLDTPTRALLPQIVEEIHTVLSDDWIDNEFSVLATEEDTIIARFKLDSLDSEKGLVAYMNVLARDNRKSRFLRMLSVCAWF